MAMRVTMLAEVEPRPRNVAIGTFDGVHLGHQAVIAGADTVLTFNPHPLSVLHPERAPKLITPFEVRRDLIGGLGVSELVVIPFDDEFAHLTAEQFIAQVLIKKLDARKVSIGENFNFGAEAKGSPAMLMQRPEFQTRIVPMIEVDGETVSSGRIRALVESGDVAEAQRCLGAPFMIEGEVVKGEQRGRELGFPTANQIPDPNLVTPGHGVYATFANGVPAATNVGVRPTFESELGLLIETHLIDRSEDLYGQNMRVAFVERLRGEERFDSAAELVEQMRRDVEDSRRICARFGGGS